MFIHPDVILTQAHDHQRALIDDADRHRLLRLAQRGGHRRAAARARPDGNLSACEPRVAAPAR
jgi:hypothetical protein